MTDSVPNPTLSPVAPDPSPPFRFRDMLLPKAALERLGSTNNPLMFYRLRRSRMWKLRVALLLCEGALIVFGAVFLLYSWGGVETLQFRPPLPLGYFVPPPEFAFFVAFIAALVLLQCQRLLNDQAGYMKSLSQGGLEHLLQTRLSGDELFLHQMLQFCRSYRGIVMLVVGCLIEFLAFQIGVLGNGNIHAHQVGVGAVLYLLTLALFVWAFAILQYNLEWRLFAGSGLSRWMRGLSVIFTVVFALLSTYMVFGVRVFWINWPLLTIPGVVAMFLTVCGTAYWLALNNQRYAMSILWARYSKGDPDAHCETMRLPDLLLVAFPYLPRSWTGAPDASFWIFFKSVKVWRHGWFSLSVLLAAFFAGCGMWLRNSEWRLFDLGAVIYLILANLLRALVVAFSILTALVLASRTQGNAVVLRSASYYWLRKSAGWALLCALALTSSFIHWRTHSLYPSHPLIFHARFVYAFIRSLATNAISNAAFLGLYLSIVLIVMRCLARLLNSRRKRSCMFLLLGAFLLGYVDYHLAKGWRVSNDWLIRKILNSIRSSQIGPVFTFWVFNLPHIVEFLFLIFISNVIRQNQNRLFNGSTKPDKPPVPSEQRSSPAPQKGLVAPSRR